MPNGRRRPPPTLPDQAAARAGVATASRLSRFTAENQYGMVGFGAGPAGSTVMGPDTADAAAGITGGMTPDLITGTRNLVLPGRFLEDPAFWLVATLGAIIGLAAYSAGPPPSG